MFKVKGKVTKSLLYLGVVLALGVGFLLYYNHKTACPDVAVYVKCKNFFD
jgi:hypothetical protein